MKGVNLTRSLREPLVLRRLGVFGLLEIAFLRLDLIPLEPCFYPRWEWYQQPIQ
jgi:hypothetical protein